MDTQLFPTHVVWL